ncbi:unnamed protein product, partial [Gongylonema pulchrum]|uniref:Thiolase_N domain-containing protein n=1 Tax=Gongylonema pulchrum TaxID=637853 RepID=A0A183DHA6_9BILA
MSRKEPTRNTDAAAGVATNRKGPPIISAPVIVGEHRLFGGKMTDERICLANAVTGQV